MEKIMKEYDIIRDQLIFNYICYYLNISRIDLNPLPSIQSKEKEKHYFYLNKHK